MNPDGKETMNLTADTKLSNGVDLGDLLQSYRDAYEIAVDAYNKARQSPDYRGNLPLKWYRDRYNLTLGRMQGAYNLAYLLGMGDQS